MEAVIKVIVLYRNVNKKIPVRIAAFNNKMNDLLPDNRKEKKNIDYQDSACRIILMMLKSVIDILKQG